MRIKYLDALTLDQGDLEWLAFKDFEHFEKYNITSKEEFIPRAFDADILLINKTKIDQSKFERLPNLKCICVTATGYDIIDIDSANARGIAVYNVVGYSTQSVAQHVFAMLLARYTRIHEHILSVQNGDWYSAEDFSYLLGPTRELAGKIMGIMGMGKIGSQVAKLANAFGMEVIANVRRPEKLDSVDIPCRFVEKDELFALSDVVSLHIPLTHETKLIVNRSLLQTMKPGATLINTARGGLINELELAEILKSRPDMMALLDVLSEEPPKTNHPLIGLKNCWVTPHNSWMPVEARQRLVDQSAKNIHDFINGDFTNSVNM